MRLENPLRLLFCRLISEVVVNSIALEGNQNRIKSPGFMAKQADNIAVRLLVMAYALGIVLIGAHPFQQHRGGILGYIKEESREIWSMRWLPKDWLDGEINLNIGQPTSESARLAGNPQGLFRGGKDKELDNLNRSDRSELNSLIDSFAD